MKISTEGLFIRLAIVVSVIWVAVTATEIPSDTETIKGMVDLAALVVLGIVVILGIGLGVQKLADYIASKRE